MASSINVGGGGSTIVTILVAVFIIGIIVFVIKKNPNLLKGIFGGGSGKVGAAVGATLPGPNIYPNLGDLPRNGAFGYNIANSGTSFRDNVSFPCDGCARETTWFFTPGTGGGGGSTGEDLTVKMGSHGDNASSLIGFGGIPMSGGGGSWKSEGPHGNDGDVVASGPNDGSVELTGDTPMGIKGISWSMSDGNMHHEIWTSTDDGANWTMKAQFEGQTGSGDKGKVPDLICPVPPDEDGVCQDTLRIDGIVGTPQEHFHKRTMVKIEANVEPVGGQSAGAEIPTQDRDGGGGGGDDGGGEAEPPADEEDEEPTDGEDEDGDGGGNTETGVESCTGNQCVCNNGGEFTLTASQTCAANCTPLCGGAAGTARRNRSRRGNLGKRVLYSYMSNRIYRDTSTFDTRIFRAGMARISIQ